MIKRCCEDIKYYEDEIMPNREGTFDFGINGFEYCIPDIKFQYTKPPKTLLDQIELLKSLGIKEAWWSNTRNEISAVPMSEILRIKENLEVKEWKKKN